MSVVAPVIMKLFFCLIWPWLYLKKAKIHCCFFLKICYASPIALVCPLLTCSVFVVSLVLCALPLPQMLCSGSSVIFLGRFSIAQCTSLSEKFFCSTALVYFCETITYSLHLHLPSSYKLLMRLNIFQHLLF